MKANRAPSSLWCVRRGPDFPNGYVLTCDDDEVRVTWFESSDRSSASTIFLSRRDARLLAKRINQCLDATVIR